MIEKHYTKTAQIQRFQTTTGAKKALSVAIANVPCHIQPFSGDETQGLSGSFGKEFLMFCASTHDIKDEDQIFVDDLKYRIISIEKFAFMRQCKHQEIRIKVFE
jgi:hypothetical protein